MRFNLNACFVVGITAVSAMTTSADARAIHHRHAGYPYYEDSYDAYRDQGGSVPFDGGDFVYGANRAPYGSDGNWSGDFQLQGR
jgi:hypothetical protein